MHSNKTTFYPKLVDMTLNKIKEQLAAKPRSHEKGPLDHCVRVLFGIVFNRKLLFTSL